MAVDPADMHAENDYDPTAHFGWEPCALSVVSRDGTHLMQCVADCDGRYGVKVSLARPLSWDKKKAQYRWHKTWRVPDIAVTADAAALRGTGGVEARIAVVCNSNKSEHQLEDAGVTSTATGPSGADVAVSMVDGIARFSRLRLMGTTATFGGRSFHFLVSLLRREPGDINSFTVIASVISTPFAVYSRKNADKQKSAIDKKRLLSGRWSEGYSFIPFDPKELHRTFVKKVTGPDGKTVEQVIDNSWEGLLNYFAAPNIRHKVRHPLFLAIRFSHVLTILRDSLRFPVEDEDALRSFICSCGFPLGCERDPAVDIGHGEFLPPNVIALRSSAFSQCPPHVREKLCQLLSVIKGPALGFVPDDTLVPTRYQPVFNVDQLIPLYTRLYATEFATEPEGDELPGPDGKRFKPDPLLLENSGTGTGSYTDTSRGAAPYQGLSRERAMEEFDSSSPSRRASTAVDVSPQSAECDDGTKEVFSSYFMSLHAELRRLLSTLVDVATEAISCRREDLVTRLRCAYTDFTDALTVHAYVEDTVLFSKLKEKVPQVTDSYSIDHTKECKQLEGIQETLGLDKNRIVKDMAPESYAKLFMQISELAAVHKRSYKFFFPVVFYDANPWSFAGSCTCAQLLKPFVFLLVERFLL